MTLDQLNSMPAPQAEAELLRCCGSRAWVGQMLSHRPFKNLTSMCETADRVWHKLSKNDWLEAFTHHPRIGDVGALRAKFASTSAWASEEQKGAAEASEDTLQKLATGNQAYEKHFGHIFLVCATGKSATQMLTLLEERMGNEAESEIRIAAGEQAKITRLRLEKLLS